MEIKNKKNVKFTKELSYLLCFGLIGLCLSVVACERHEPLANGENIDPMLLIGEWDCVKFAYIDEDSSVSDVVILSKGHFVIPSMTEKWTFVHTNEIFYDHLLSGNSIKLTMNGSTFVMPPSEEMAICEALENAYSIHIQDDELMIYFTDINSKNLLVLKKR